MDLVELAETGVKQQFMATKLTHLIHRTRRPHVYYD